MKINDFGSVVKVWDFTDDGKSGTINIQESYKDETKPNGYRVEFQHKFTKVYGDAYEFMKNHKTPLYVKLHEGSLKNRYNPEKNTTAYYLNIFGMEEATDEDFAPKGNRNMTSNGNGNRSGYGGGKSANSYAAKPKSAAPQYSVDDDQPDLPF